MSQINFFCGGEKFFNGSIKLRFLKIE